MTCMHGLPYPPGGPTPTDRLLEGAIDFHHHGYPEVSFEMLTRMEDNDELSVARSAGMAGIVLKSHMWPTVGRAYHLKNQVPGIEVIPSIVLNHSVGGFNPIAVESAALQGAKVMFMPTWSAAHDMERGGMSKYLRKYIKKASELNPEKGLRLTNEKGKVKEEVRECVSIASDYNMTVCSGHVSPQEAIALAQASKDYGVDSIVFSHPDSHSVGATREEIRDMVQLDGYCEFCALGTLPAFQRLKPSEALEIIEEIRPERAILTTDYFFEWAPPASETLRMLIGTFLDLGMSEEDVRIMVRNNPAKMLGWDEKKMAEIEKSRSEVLQNNRND